MSKASKRVQEEIKMDMTPMIDCVFLLMIFFVLVIDLSQKDLEDLILPKANYAEPDESPPAIRPIVNINQKGQVIYQKNTYYDPSVNGDDYTSINELLFKWRDYVVDKKKIKTEQVGGGMTMKVIDDPVLIRADKWTEWHYVGKFMMACTHKDAAFWKLELALSEVDKEDKMNLGGKQ